jgi:hypothetical protein
VISSNSLSDGWDPVRPAFGDWASPRVGSPRSPVLVGSEVFVESRPYGVARPRVRLRLQRVDPACWGVGGRKLTQLVSADRNFPRSVSCRREASHAALQRRAADPNFPRPDPRSPSASHERVPRKDPKKIIAREGQREGGRDARSTYSRSTASDCPPGTTQEAFAWNDSPTPCARSPSSSASRARGLRPHR